MTELEDVKRVAQEAADKAVAQVTARIEDIRNDVKASDEYGTWKGLPAKWRRIIPAAICLALVVGFVAGALAK